MDKRSKHRLWKNKQLTAYIERFAHRCVPTEWEDAKDEAWVAIQESTNGGDPYAIARRAIWRYQKRRQTIRRREAFYNR